ncbi:GumC family protein [Thermodesulfobacteriota bacterium]
MNSQASENKRPVKIPAKPIDPLGSILNHLHQVLMITCGILVVGVLGVLVGVKPFYSADAVIKIEPVVPKVLYGKEEASIMPYYDDFVRTQINQVKSYPVLSRALEIYQEKGFNWQLPEESTEQAVGRLGVRLNIAQLRDTQLFALTMTSRRKEGLAEIINATVEAYLETIGDEQMNKDASRLSFLRNRKLEIEKELADKYLVLQKISAKYAVGITDEKNIYVYLQAIVDLTQTLVKATSRRIQVESKLKELVNQMGKLTVIDITSDVDEWVEKDQAIRDNRIQLSRKLQDMRLFLAGVNENHPDRQEYEENLARLNEVQDSMLERSREVGEKVLRGKLLSDQNKKILELETEYAAALKTEEKLRSELTEAEQKATDVNTQMMKASTLRTAIQRLQDSLLRIDERIDQLEVESRSPGRIALMTVARPPGQPSAGKRSKMMIMVVLVSLVSGIGYAVARDKLDDRIHSVSDIERVLGFAPTGHILEPEQEPGPIEDPYRVVLDHPYSQLAEQYKTIAFALSVEHERHQSSIYSCLSLNQEEGTSTFITNALNALKGSPQKKILLDLNVWNPLTPKIISNNGRGLWDVLEGACNLKEAIVTDSPFPFHILPIGGWQKANKSLFQEFGLDAMVQILRQDYEFIMVDSPPLMLSTDAKFISQLADVTVLIVTAEQVREKELFRAVKTLDKIGVEVISVILNRVKLKRGKYYRSTMKKYHQLVDSKDGQETA